MITSIMVPLDGSALSEQALPLASRIASSAHATVHLVQVHAPSYTIETADLRPGAVPTIDTTLDHEIRAGERSYLAAFQRRLSDEHGIKATTALLDGPIVEALRRHAAAISADLVVMTTHGRGAVSRFWLGSVADGLVRQSHAPVLLERPHAPPAHRPAPSQMQHILIPLDGSALAESIIEPAVTLGAPLGACYTLLHVLDPLLLVGAAPLLYTAVPDVERERERELSAARYLDGVAARLRERGLNVTTRVVLSPSPAPAILEQAHEAGVDLIALATHGRSGLARVMLGSAADKVVRGAEMPVLVYRPAERVAITEQSADEARQALAVVH
jgi:nucleotide-binding universal stress UspA family protein